MIDWPTLAEILETGSLIIVLGFIIFAIFRGWVWPKEHVDRTIQAQQEASEQTAKILCDGIEKNLDQLRNSQEKAIETSVTKGISAGLAEGFIKMSELNQKSEEKK